MAYMVGGALFVGLVLVIWYMFQHRSTAVPRSPRKSTEVPPKHHSADDEGMDPAERLWMRSYMEEPN